MELCIIAIYLGIITYNEHYLMARVKSFYKDIYEVSPCLTLQAHVFLLGGSLVLSEKVP